MTVITPASTAVGNILHANVSSVIWVDVDAGVVRGVNAAVGHAVDVDAAVGNVGNAIRNAVREPWN